MVEQNPCKGCNQRPECQKVYEQFGNVKGSSIVVKVIVAFLLPLIVFIGCLAAFERILSNIVANRDLRTVFSFLLAVAVTLVCILIIKLINEQISKSK